MPRPALLTQCCNSISRLEWSECGNYLNLHIGDGRSHPVMRPAPAGGPSPASGYAQATTPPQPHRANTHA